MVAAPKATFSLGATQKVDLPIGDLFQEETGATGNGSAAVPTRLVTDTATVRLLTAYASIQSGAIRRNISELVERIAGSAGSPARKKPRR